MRWSFLSTEHWSDHTWTSGSNSGLPSTRETWTNWREFNILRDMERVQQITKKIVKGLEHLSYKKKMREPEPASLEKKMLRLDPTKEYKYLKEIKWIRGKHYSECCLVTGQEATGTKWKVGNSKWTWEKTSSLQ